MGPALPKRRLRAAIAAAAVGVVAAAATAFTVVTAEAATTGCEVDYQVTAAWPGGFNANVDITNLGDTAVDPWKLEWDFPGAQQVANAWNATATQSGRHVTAAGVEYNKRIAAGSTASFGFSGTFTGTNAVPETFKLNGVACTGDTGPSPTNPPTNVTASPTAVPTGGPGQDEWNPPANLVQPLDQVWQHEESTYTTATCTASATTAGTRSSPTAARSTTASAGTPRPR